MNRRDLFGRVACISLLSATTAWAAPTQYTVVDLHSAAVGNPSSLGVGVGDGQQVGVTGNGHALLWTGTAASVVDLNPPGGGPSQAASVSGGKQVGQLQAPDGENHATIWSGTAASALDIHPAGYHSSGAQRIRGDSIVGFANVFLPDSEEVSRAALWTGPSHTFVSLHPAGFASSEASDVYGNLQGGFASVELNGDYHALIWSGSAESFVDLHPAGFPSSTIAGVWGNQQVGVGFELGNLDSSHALLWTGTADSVIDLHPAGYTSSGASEVANGVQVGQGVDTARHTHALAWFGTADSVIDLNQFLPIGFDGATANGIDDQGNIIGIAFVAETGDNHAVMWVPVTNPTPIPLPAGVLSGAPVLAFALIAVRGRKLRWS